MRKYLIIIILTVVVCVGFSVFLSRPKTSLEEYDYKNNIIEVNISGGIVFEGRYKINSGTKLYELINLAGGLLKEANTNNINLNEIITQDISYNIPVTDKTLSDKVNINTAKFEELLTVPGLTEQRSASIIIHRQTYGFFKSIEEIVNVKYIGNATFDKIKDYITI
jgi:competence protein ComEA